MSFVYPSIASTAAFASIIGAVLAALIGGVYIANLRLGGPAARRTGYVAIGTFSWLAFISGVVATGALQTSPMPSVPLFLLTLNAAGVVLALSPVGTWLAQGLPIPALIAFQAFRLPLELVLHSWVEQGTIPATMTWTGQNLDIITGILALITAPLAGKSRVVAWGFNFVGFALLLNVGRVAMMSSPLPFAWGVTPPLELAFYLPFAWIVPVCVAGALAGHVILTRSLLTKHPTWFSTSTKVF